MMADDLDIEALLEAPFRSKSSETGERGNERKKDYRDKHYTSPSSRSRRRSRSPLNSRSRSRSRSTVDSSSSLYYSSTTRDNDRKYSHDSRSFSSKHRGRSQSPDHDSNNVRRRSLSPIHHRMLNEAQRDRRTVFCRQLAQRLEADQLREFCEQAGSVRDVRIVYDKISRRSKGVAYVEFTEEETVPKAVTLTGKKLLGIPIIIELTETEKNRLAEEAAAALRQERLASQQTLTSYQLFISNLHPSIGEADMRRIFQPFGELLEVHMFKESDGIRCTATLHYRSAEEAKQAAEKMNGFDLAGRPMRISLKGQGTLGGGNGYKNGSTPVNSPSSATAAGTANGAATPSRHQDEGDLYQSGNMLLFDDNTEMLLRTAREAAALKALAAAGRPSPCLLLQHLYDPATETAPDWEVEIAEEVREECSKFGRLEHIYVPKTADGDVFVRYVSTDSAQAACASLAGRWFGGRQIVALYLPLEEYLRHYPVSS